MKHGSSTSTLPLIALAFSLLCAPSYASADWLGDLSKAIDLAKEVGNILPGGGDASTTPTPSPAPQPNTQNTEPAVSQDLSTIFSKTQYYYQRPQYFDSLGFDLGEYIVVKPLDKGTFNNLYVPSYKGIPRLGLSPEYTQVKLDYTQRDYSTRYYPTAVVDRFKNDMTIYHNLRLLDLMAKHATAENLKIDTSNEPTFRSKSRKRLYTYTFNGKGHGSSFQYTPRYHIESLTTTLLPKAHERYFCDPEETCSSDSFLREVSYWGGHHKNNEFKSRKAYFNFIETEVPKLKALAKSLSSEVYLVGLVRVGGMGGLTYDFSRKGFEVTLHAAKKPFYYVPRNKEKNILIAQNKEGRMKGQSFFIPMSETDAETLQSKIKVNSRLSLLYFVVKAEIYNAHDNHTTAGHSPTYPGIGLAYDITGSIVEFYTDELLTNKVAEARINP